MLRYDNVRSFEGTSEVLRANSEDIVVEILDDPKKQANSARVFIKETDSLTNLVRNPVVFQYINRIFLCAVPVTTAWSVLRLRMEERPPIWRVAANKLNKQSRTADKGRSSSLGLGRGANNSSPLKTKLF